MCRVPACVRYRFLFVASAVLGLGSDQACATFSLDEIT